MMLRTKTMTAGWDCRRGLREQPQLRHLFLELCGEPALTAAQYGRFLTEVREDFGAEGKMLCITGEPLLREDLEEILGAVHEAGFRWGMTTDGTRIGDAQAQLLRRCGADTVAVSIDGMAESHDRIHRTPGSWQQAMAGLDSLLRAGIRQVQVTTVADRRSIGELWALYRELAGRDIGAWRLLSGDLTPEGYRCLLTLIRELRRRGEPVCYSFTRCPVPERDLRYADGIFIPGVLSNGDIATFLGSGLHPLRGNILSHRFREVWEQGYFACRRSLDGDAGEGWFRTVMV